MVQWVDYESIGQEACSVSMYKHINKTSVPVTRNQTSFAIGDKESCQGTRTQFPLALAWAVTIHKCQGLTLPEIVDMTPTKGWFRSGQAYVAFSHVCDVSKLHIINYAHSQVHVCEYVAKGMERLRKNKIPDMPLSSFDLHTDSLKLVHVNIGNIKARLDDIQAENFLMMADIISFNETHLGTSDMLSTKMLGLEQDVSIFHHDHNSCGGGVALVIHNKLQLTRININRDIELFVAKISYPTEMYIMSVYRSPAYHRCDLAKTMTKIFKEFKDILEILKTVGDINEDILLTSEEQCCSMFCAQGFKQVVTKPTGDSGTLIDHV